MSAHRSIGVPGKHLSLPVPRLVTTGLSGCPRLDYSRDVSVTASGDRLMKLAIALGTAASILSAAGHTDLAPTIAQAAQASAPEAASGRLNVPVVYYKLPNGLKVVLSRDTTSPTACIAVYYNIGFRNEPKDRTGFAHLFEHMMFQGSANLGKMAFIRLVESNGGLLNGSTRFDFTNYFQVVPVARARADPLGRGGPHARRSTSTSENLKNQQEVVKNEVKVNVLNQPYGGFPWIDLPMAANENWYNAHNFYGDLAHLDAATLDDVRAFFKTFYAPNNAVLVVTGDFRRRSTRRPGSRSTSATSPRRRFRRRPICASRARRRRNAPAGPIRWRIGPRSASAITCRIALTPEWYAFGLLDEALAQGSDSLLYDELVRKKGLTGGVDAGINWGLGNMFDYSGPDAVDGAVLPRRDGLVRQAAGRRSMRVVEKRAKGRARPGRRSTARA